MLKKILFCVVTLVLCANLFAQSPFDKALSLNGQQQYFEIPDATYLNLDLTRDITIEFWFKPNSTEPFNLVNKWKIGPIGLRMYHGQGFLIDLNRIDWKIEGKIQLRYIDALEGFPSPGSFRFTRATCTETGGGLTMSGTSVSIGIGIWHHIAIVLEKNGGKTFFINGTEFSRGSSSRKNISTPQYPLCFGGLPIAIDSTLEASYYFDGCIDEVRIWNTVRSGEQIQATMNDTLGRDYYTSPDKGLVGYYRFDKLENLGLGDDNLLNDVRDLSYNENHGEVKGAANLVDHTILTYVKPSNPDIMLGYEINQNYPNPFNPATKISFYLHEAGPVNLIIYDVLGRVVETLIDSQMPEGHHEFEWNSKNLPSGIYICRLESNEYTKTIKMLLEK